MNVSVNCVDVQIRIFMKLVEGDRNYTVYDQLNVAF